ncbi:MAG: DNA polymerase III subunit gamma/tau [Burkholderiales bacterium]
MVTVALARKWRPKTFAELVGQEHVVAALANALGGQRLHHAWLFTGTRGVGKTTLARIVAKALNCETGVTATPCGQCAACMAIDAGRFIDVIELDAASNTQVDNMRELLENALYAPTAGRFKVYIIDEVHMLSKSAFNAMLKTLEEPPAHVKFVLATTDPQKIPVTVLSRCLQFNLKQIPEAQIVQRLQAVLQAEGIAADAEGLARLARAAQGSLRDALSLADQAVAHGAGKIDGGAVRAMLGAVDGSHLIAILRALAAGDGSAVMAEAGRMREASLSFEAALSELASWLHRIAVAQVIPDSADAVDAADSEVAAVAELAAALAPEDVQLCYQIAIQGRQDFTYAPDDYAGFTIALLRMLAFRPDGGAAARPVAARTPGRVAAPAPVAKVAGVPVADAGAIPGSATATADAGDWAQLAASLNGGGMVRMLAQHCELIQREGSRFEFRVAAAHKHLLAPTYQAKMKEALERALGESVRLSFAVGDTAAATPAAIEAKETSARTADAASALDDDPFVRELKNDFGGRVVPSTIKPLQ